MMSVSKLARLISSIGFCRAILVCGVCLLMLHAVTFEQFVILVLFGLTLDAVPIRRNTAQKLRAKKHAH